MAAPTESATESASNTPHEGPVKAASEKLSRPLASSTPEEILSILAKGDAGEHILQWGTVEATAVVGILKNGADRYWLINPNESLRMADAILRIGMVRGDRLQSALGLMARADALKYLGSAREAWDVFQQAGGEFRSAGDELGWARTRIGMLAISSSVNKIDEALAEAEHARSIFVERGANDLLTRSDINLALVYSWIGDHRRSLIHSDEAQRRAEVPGAETQRFLGLIYTNRGSVYANLLGDYRVASFFFEKARVFAEERREVKNVALAELDLAFVETEQGRYRKALQLLLHARSVYAELDLALDATHVDREIVECYIQLCRFDEACELAHRVVDSYRHFGDDYYQAHALVNLATAQAEIQELTGAYQSLDIAEQLFRTLGARSWAAAVRLRRGRLALHLQNAKDALDEATAAELHFASAALPIHRASARGLQAEALLCLGRVQEAGDVARDVLSAARTCGISPLRYSAHLVLGKVVESQGDVPHALRHYLAANAAVDRMQQDLTITLRSGFLEDKNEALRALVAGHVRCGDAVGALTALERAKSRWYRDYATNPKQLHWAGRKAENTPLLEELERLRTRHRWLFALAHDELEERGDKPKAMSRDEAMRDLAVTERQMRLVTERLYLNAAEDALKRGVVTHSLCSVQEYVEEDTVLLEFYSDGAEVYVFVVDRDTCSVQKLSASTNKIERLIEQFQLNVASALQHAPSASASRVLCIGAQRLLEQLYTELIMPIRANIVGRSRIYIVPFGVLHYLPFHLLRENGSYLLDSLEVVILPTAGLIEKAPPIRVPGACVIAHSADGLLPQVRAEAEMVGSIFESQIHTDDSAIRQALDAEPKQILHIAAHAAYRLDQPDFSFIDLADGQLYTDDLLQHDLSYELVTLSACETGRAHIAARDELIGLGRGFLYAGAGALIASLWRVGDEIALPLMRYLYEALRDGSSKAAALRTAQIKIFSSYPDMHPAYWGPFQLIGDAGPLSRDPVSIGNVG